MKVNEFQDALDSRLFALPPDHVVVALRGRTGHEHLGWRKPSQNERLRCAALLASDAYQRTYQDRYHAGQAYEHSPADLPEGELTDTELSITAPPAELTGTAKILALVTQLDRDPVGLTGADIMADVQAIETLQSWLTATQAGRLARLAEPGYAGDPTALAYANAQIDPDLSEAEPESRHYELAGLHLAVGHLGAALCISPISAGYRLSDAQDLRDNLPTLHTALQKGTIDPARARILQQRTKVLDRLDERRHVVDQLLPLARRHNPGRFATLVDAAVIRTDPDAAEQRRLEAQDRRGITIDALDDGMARFIATLPATEAQLAYDLIDSIAQALKGFDDRCADHRRADAFTTLIELLAAGHTISAQTLLDQVLTTTCTCTPTENPSAADVPEHEQRTSATADPDDAPTAGPCHTDPVGTGAGGVSAPDKDAQPDNPAAPAAEGPTRTKSPEPTDDGASKGDTATSPTGPGTTKRWSLPTKQGRKTHATIVLPWEAFTTLPGTVAELLGHGMITSAWAKTLLEAAATVTMLVIDPKTGRSIAVGDRTYRPAQDVRDKVTTAYPACIVTGCSRPSQLCDCEHCVAFRHRHPELGGTSGTENLYPVCRFHHRLKTFGGWTYEPHPDGIQVRSPLGNVTTTITGPAVARPSRSPDAPPPF